MLPTTLFHGMLYSLTANEHALFSKNFYGCSYFVDILVHRLGELGSAERGAKSEAEGDTSDSVGNLGRRIASKLRSCFGSNGSGGAAARYQQQQSAAASGTDDNPSRPTNNAEEKHESDLDDLPPVKDQSELDPESNSKVTKGVERLHTCTHDNANAAQLKQMGLMTGLAIALHNFPEGLATFVAALVDTKLGIAIALAIAMHNIPEGTRTGHRNCNMGSLNRLHF